MVRAGWRLLQSAGHLVEAVQLVEPVRDGLAIRAHGKLERVVHVLVVVAVYLLLHLLATPPSSSAPSAAAGAAQLSPSIKLASLEGSLGLGLRGPYRT